MNNLYLLTGDELYERNEYLSKIKEDFGELVKGINYITIDNDTISSLENEINTYPFGYSKKLIIVKINKKGQKEADDKGFDWFTDSLQETLQKLDNSVCVVFVGDFTTKGKIYKFVEKYGQCFSFNIKKENELINWCQNLFKENDIKISNQDISYIVNLCGTEKLTLKNEIEKLICYAFDTKCVTKLDIDKLCIRTSDIIIFDLTDCLGKKNKKNALICLNDLIENKEPIQKIAIMIAKHFKALLVAKIAIEQNKNLLEELNTKSTYMANKYKEQAKRFTRDELVFIIKELSKLDVNSKIGKIDLKIGLEKLICEQ